MKLWNILFYCLYLQACTTSISGTVTLENGLPINTEGGKINISPIQSNSSNRSYIVDIDESGNFKSADSIENGLYLVEPLIPGYTANSIKINFNENDSQHIKILAKPLPKTNNKIFKVPVSQPMDRGTGGVNITPPKF